MAISYQRSFEHQDWIDNEDVVQAEGERGFNKVFHALEDELDSISAAVGTIDVEIQKVQHLQFVAAQSAVNVPAGATSNEFDVETYDRSTLPANVEKAYFAVILPISGPTQVQSTFMYSALPGQQMKVKVVFFNPGAAVAQFNYRILTLATAP